jgi:hypothetical protein
MTKKVKTDKIKNIDRKSKRTRVRPFRLSAKKLFLTYSPCTLSPEQALSQLQIILNYKIESYVITREKSEKDSDFHLHCFLALKKKCNIVSSSRLDLEIIGTEPLSFCHGNYQTVKDKNDCVNYVLKQINFKEDEENLIFSEDFREFISEDVELLSLDDVMLNLAEKGDVTSAMKLLKERNSYRFIREHLRVEKSLNQIALRARGFKPKFNLSNFVLPKNLIDTIELAHREDKSIYLLGESNTGKSAFVLAYVESQRLKPLVINNLDSLREFVAGFHDCIVLDDSDLDLDLTREVVIKLLSVYEEVTLKLRFSNVRIPAGVKRFFVSNKKLEYYIGDSMRNDPAISRRFAEIDIGSDKLYAYTSTPYSTGFDPPT